MSCVGHLAHQCVQTANAYSSISVIVPTVERGLCDVDFCSIELQGLSLRYDRHQFPLNFKIDGHKRIRIDISPLTFCMSVSNARDDFPEPDKPVITTSLSRGISRRIFFAMRSCTSDLNCFHHEPLAAKILC